MLRTFTALGIAAAVAAAVLATPAAAQTRHAADARHYAHPRQYGQQGYGDYGRVFGFSAPDSGYSEDPGVADGSEPALGSRDCTPQCGGGF